VLRPSRRFPHLLLLLVVALTLLGAWVPTAVASAPSSGVGFTLGSNGTVDAGLNFVDANGSALRYAMDGYFAPLVNLLPESNASKAALLQEINTTEILLPGAFGDHDGKVNAVDVSRFQSLVTSESKYIPVSTFTGVLNLTLDGNVPTSDQLASVSFTEAIGLDTSSAPMGVTATLALAFAWSGVGNSHTLKLAWNLPSILGNLSLPVAPINVSFATPPAIAITSIIGLNDSHVSNDPLGWGSASASGQYTPIPGRSVVIKFGPSFPTGDVLVVGVIVVAAGASVGALLLRRRRGRRKSTPSPTGSASDPGTGVGPSSGSG
jgi:hypothetical protein